MEEEKKVVGREYISITKCNLDNDGYWKAINETHDRVLYEGETEWIDEKVEAMSIDSNSQNAIQTVMNSTLNYLMQNVYQNGFSGLVEYRAYERRLADAKSETAKTV